jgi:hypothetical protein
MRRAGIVGRRASATAAPPLAWAALTALAAGGGAAGCRGQFDGPYACEMGYASCTTQDGCETNVTTNGAHCGSCGHSCNVGASCLDAQCGRGATPLAPLSASAQGPLRANSSAVFWSDSSGSIYEVSAATADGGAVAPPVATGGFTCNSGSPFAVDENNLYYWSDGVQCNNQPSGNCTGLTQVALSGGQTTVLVGPPSSGNAPIVNANVDTCGSLATDGTFVYWLATDQQGNAATITIYRASVGMAGQSPKVLATAQGYSGPSSSTLVVSGTNLVFDAYGQNNSPSFEIVPIGGGPATPLPFDVNTYGNGTPFAADDANVYVASGGCSCDNNGGISGPPSGVITKVPLSGAPATTLATFSGELGDIAVDSNNVYWSTDSDAWRVPLLGGEPTSIAGNLTNGNPAYQCSGCGGENASPIAIAVTASGLFIADRNAGENELLEVTK